jgi:hypothetical protein
LSAAEKQAAYRERQRLSALDEGEPWAGLSAEEREHAIREHYGYAQSESRTQEKRNAAAQRIIAQPQTKHELQAAHAIWAAHAAVMPVPQRVARPRVA